MSSPLAGVPSRVEARVRLVRRVLVEERDQLGAERLFLGTPRELHAYRPVNRGSRRSLNAAMPSTRSADVVGERLVRALQLERLGEIGLEARR